MTDTPKPYDVGYKKPPKHTQFKKGKSGNKKGRPKGARGLKTDLQAELGERITINENGKSLTLTKQQLMIKQLTNAALKGDLRAIQKLSDLALTLLGPDDHQPETEQRLPDEDEAILDAFVAQRKEASDEQ